MTTPFISKSIAILTLTLAVMTLSSTAHAQTTQAKPVEFQHNDWQLVCDNTRTCRAVGYQDQNSDNNNPVALMLKRNAGANQRVRAYVMFGDELYEKENQLCSSTQPIKFNINGKSLGEVKPDEKDLGMGSVQELNKQQTYALINALQTSSHIQFTMACSNFVVSDKGSTAVLLKMDEAQGRIGTKGAIIKKGDKPESSVLPALPVPVVKALKLDKQASKEIKANDTLKKQVEKLALATLPIEDEDNYNEDAPYCPALTDSLEDRASIYGYMQDWTLYRLNDSQLLAEHGCWSGAYNAGSGYWLVDLNKSKTPYQVKLITYSGVDYEGGEIFQSHKSRGLGDCWSMAMWQWAKTADGHDFVQTEESSTGMCRSIAAGGSYNLPTVVTEVIKTH